MRKLSAAVLVAMVTFAVSACRAEVEDPGRAPDVDVRGGEMPDIDVDPADVRVSTDTQTVRVPEVEVRP